jgi:hypothetical protein
VGSRESVLTRDSADHESQGVAPSFLPAMDLPHGNIENTPTIEGIYNHNDCNDTERLPIYYYTQGAFTYYHQNQSLDEAHNATH